jgi:hypothetical protein
VPNPNDDLFSHQALTEDYGWFDRFYFNLHSPGADVTLSQGMGKYPQPGVVDGFGMLVEKGGRQRNFRASREGAVRDTKLEAGPLSAEILEPLKRWRLALGENDAGFSYELEFEGDLAPIDAGRINRRSRKTGALVDFSHFVQVGRVNGKLVIDGQTREIRGDSWFGLRDRSWGIRPNTGEEPLKEAPHPTLGRHDWVCGRVGDRAVFYMLAGGGSHGPHVLGAGLADARGEIKVESVERTLDWDDRGRFQGAHAKLKTESGETIELRATAPIATLYLRGALYGGWHGQKQGAKRGPLHCESERWATGDPALVAEIAGLNDHLVRFESGAASGFGIYEVASGI